MLVLCDYYHNGKCMGTKEMDPCVGDGSIQCTCEYHNNLKENTIKEIEYQLHRAEWMDVDWLDNVPVQLFKNILKLLEN